MGNISRKIFPLLLGFVLLCHIHHQYNYSPYGLPCQYGIDKIAKFLRAML